MTTADTSFSIHEVAARTGLSIPTLRYYEEMGVLNWAADGITANAVHPGTVASTNLARYMDPDLLARIKNAPYFRDQSVEQGAATSVLLAASPLVAGVSGRYFENCNEAEVVHPELGGGNLPGGVAEYALDEGNARRLWALSEGTLAT